MSSQPSVVSASERSGGTLSKILLGGFIGLLLLILLVILGTRWALADTYLIPSESMEPTLNIGERIEVDPDYYDTHDLQTGDVVVFDGEGTFSPYQSESQLQRGVDTVLGWIGIAPAQNAVVKRVVGVGGDTVACCTDDGQLTLNGDPLDEPYLAEPDTVASRDEFEIVVPENRFFALGDNRHVSYDSRSLFGAPGGGMISQDKIIGPVLDLNE